MDKNPPQKCYPNGLSKLTYLSKDGYLFNPSGELREVKMHEYCLINGNVLKRTPEVNGWNHIGSCIILEQIPRIYHKVNLITDLLPPQENVKGEVVSINVIFSDEDGQFHEGIYDFEQEEAISITGDTFQPVGWILKPEAPVKKKEEPDNDREISLKEVESFLAWLGTDRDGHSVVQKLRKWKNGVRSREKRDKLAKMAIDHTFDAYRYVFAPHPVTNNGDATGFP